MQYLALKGQRRKIVSTFFFDRKIVSTWVVQQKTEDFSSRRAGPGVPQNELLSPRNALPQLVIRHPSNARKRSTCKRVKKKMRGSKQHHRNQFKTQTGSKSTAFDVRISRSSKERETEAPGPWERATHTFVVQLSTAVVQGRGEEEREELAVVPVAAAAAYLPSARGGRSSWPTGPGKRNLVFCKSSSLAPDSRWPVAPLAQGD